MTSPDFDSSLRFAWSLSPFSFDSKKNLSLRDLGLCIPGTCTDCNKNDDETQPKKSALFKEFDHDISDHNENTEKSKNIEIENFPESNEDISITDMSWDDVQRLVAAFVFCIIGTLASNGNMVWTLIMFAYLVAMWFWWANDKQDELHNMWAKKYWVWAFEKRFTKCIFLS